MDIYSISSKNVAITVINGVEHLKMITYVQYKSSAGLNVAVTVKELS